MLAHAEYKEKVAGGGSDCFPGMYDKKMGYIAFFFC